MKKLIPLYLLCIIFQLSAYSETILQGQIEEKHTIEDAKTLLFKDLPKTVPVQHLPLLDPDLIRNIQIRVKHEQCLPDRRVNTFSNGMYAVVFFGETESRYFKPDGKLYKVEYQSYPAAPMRKVNLDHYPITTRQYLYPSGKLLLARIAFSPTEDYAFKPDGSLFMYCLGDNCYNPQGVLMMQRARNEDCQSQTEQQ